VVVVVVQRDAVVRSLVAAVAKEALRGAMSEETCAGLIRLVSAVVRQGERQTASARCLPRTDAPANKRTSSQAQ
jgi:hypothetical protein